MVMARGDITSVCILADILIEFEEMSGLKANSLKSSLLWLGEG